MGGWILNDVIDDRRVEELAALFRRAHEEIESSQFAVVQLPAAGDNWERLSRLKPERKAISASDLSGSDAT